jgi:hypothetical protein
MTVIFSMLYRDDDLLSPYQGIMTVYSVLYNVPGQGDGLSIEHGTREDDCVLRCQIW